MGIDQRRLSSSRRNALKNVIRLIPAVVILATMLSAVSCTNNNGLLPQDNGSNSPTATPTAGTGTLAFVTNFNDGKVSSFTRNILTGALKLTKGQVTAGAKSGPRGVVASPSGSFLYVANLKDDNIYEFSVNQTNGALTPLSPPSVSNGNATQPDQLAINTAGTLLWVTGRAGTVAAYGVNSSTGQLTKNSSLGGFNTPFGIALHPTLAVLYVSDLGTGLIWPLSYNTTTGALAKLTPVASSDPFAILPAAITIDAAGAALFTPDEGNGEVSSFSINAVTAALTQVGAFTNSNVGDAPLGIGIGTNAGNEFVFTANFGGASVSSFFVTNSTTLNPPPALASGYNAPKGLVVDPQSVFVYTADSGDGTVSQSTINGSCGSSICVGSTVSTENPANRNSGPFGITLAQ